MNSDTGAVVDTQPAPLRADEVQYDRNKYRLYVPGGEGYMAIYDTSDPNHLKLIEKVSTAPGAKTGAADSRDAPALPGGVAGRHEGNRQGPHLRGRVTPSLLCSPIQGFG